MRCELYYAMINIVDFLALSEDVTKETEEKLYNILDELLDIDTKFRLEDGEDFAQARKENFEGITDANDAGSARDWKEMAAIFRHLFNNGDRINSIDVGDFVTIEVNHPSGATEYVKGRVGIVEAKHVCDDNTIYIDGYWYHIDEVRKSTMAEIRKAFKKR